MLKTFNCGIGMVIVVKNECTRVVTRALEEAGEQVYMIGTVTDVEGVHYEGLFG